jgi:hypothetical protein
MSHRTLSYDAQLVLLALAAGTGPGHAIFDRIVGDTVGDYVERASIYRHLKLLARRGFIDSSHRLTDKGYAHLKAAATDWQRLATLAKERATLPAYP